MDYSYNIPSCKCIWVVPSVLLWVKYRKCLLLFFFCVIINFILLFVVGALCISVFTLDIIFMLLCDNKLFDPACYLAFV
jgi:hypothetical protein